MNVPNEPGSPPAEVRIATDSEMRDLGRRLAALLRAGDLVILAGPLGAGKTTLVQGIGAGLGVRGPVTSPTFVIARVHPVAAGPGRPWCTRTLTVLAASARWTTWIWIPTRPAPSRSWSGAPVWPKVSPRIACRSRSSPTPAAMCGLSG